MYLEHFGLLEPPFSIAPDPRYLYMSERHREALAHLLYGMESDGAFILLTGDVGTGKTTVSRCLLEQVPEDTNLALVLNPKVSALELLETICDELLGRHRPSEQVHNAVGHVSSKILVDIINRYLLDAHARGKKTVVLIEEAQNLDLEVLEQLRLLTNLETNERKLLQVILLGQPEFLDVLDRPELSQLAQRITARFHLTPLKLNEVEEYIGHRLAIAGCRRPLFSHGVIRQIFNYSGGVPRLINVICDRSLLGCYVQNQQQIDKPTLLKSAREVLGENKAASIKSKKIFGSSQLIAAVVIAFILIGVISYFYEFQTQSTSIITQDDSNALISEQEFSEDVKSENTTGNIEPVIDPDKETQSRVEAQEQVTATDIQAFIQWPDNDQRLRSNIHAYQALFESWQVNYSAITDGTPCFYAVTQGLSCLHETSGLDSLRKLNRPAVLTLYDDLNQSQYITLLELDSETAKIYLGEKVQIIPLKQLQFYWKGEFSLLWRAPPSYQNPIKLGDSGEAVIWVGQAMNEIYQRPQNLVRSYFDAELVKQIKQFQLDQGLSDDGVVGVKTLIHINQALGQKAPQLEAI